MTMRVWELSGQFGMENLHLVDRPMPAPGPGQVLVRLRAASLNFRDLLMIRGKYNPRQPLPLVPCSDGAGEVVELGPGVERVKVGNRVAGIFAQRWLAGRPDHVMLRSTLGGPLDGTLQEYRVFSEEGLVHLPAHLTWEEASTLPCAALTAWSSLVVEGSVTAGSKVVIQGTGGVSIFALQFCKMLGAETWVTSSSDEKLEKAKEMGATHVINYTTTPKWGEEIFRMTGKVGVDHVVEVGGAGTIDQSIRAIAPGGCISLIGILSGAAQEIQLTRVLMQNVRMQGIIVGHRDGFEQMNRAIAVSGLRPSVDRVFAFEEAPEAMAYMASAGHYGKIVIRVGE
jgi:NADPH:quinone reductase-like Zn-dependent oxidoreductase